jgi:hypothetical protein
MGGWCKERYNKDENNKLEGLHQKPDQMEETRWEGQNFSEVVARQEEEEEEEEEISSFILAMDALCCVCLQAGEVLDILMLAKLRIVLWRCLWLIYIDLQLYIYLFRLSYWCLCSGLVPLRIISRQEKNTTGISRLEII